MLAAGDHVAHYLVLSPLGAGGMGEVYLAEDTRLRRRVALKVLPPPSAEDEGARKRLIREAQAAATLDHPNICAVYDVGEAGGRSFIAMQYVEGQTLADRLKQGPLDLPAALAFGSEIAAALAEAHGRGILHRDIKPHNIMLAASGRVKVLDFGLAKPIAPSARDLNTATLVTEPGVVSGTAPYMSPEQIRGEPLDARSDVFSLGCVLYEMIGGVNPFLCAHAADTMSAVLSRDPSAVPVAAAPADVQRIVRKSLEKDRERRYQTMRDLAIDLEGAARDIASPASGRTAAQPASTGRRLARVSIVALVVVAAAAAGYFYLRAPTPAPLSPADFLQITGLADAAEAPSLSPDGRMVAFIRGDWFLATGQIYVKLLPGGDAVQITNDPRPKYGLTFSPDGSRVAYTVIDHGDSAATSWDTWTVPVLGGDATRLLPNAAGLTWIDDHHVLFSEIERGTGLHMGIVTAGEDRQGERRIYLPAERRAMAHYSYLSPDRRSVLVVEMDRTGTFRRCRVVPFDATSTGRAVGPEGLCTAAAWSPDGKWMYFSAAVNGASHLWRQRVPDGAPEQITFGSATEEHGVAIAPDGRSLITSVGQSQGSLWIHDDAGERLLPLDGSVWAPRVSADGEHVYCLVRRVGEPFARGLTRVSLASGKTERMLADYAIEDFDISRTGESVAFTATGDRGGRELWVAGLDRRSPPRRIATDGDRLHFARDGELIYRSLTGTANGLVRIGADGRGATRTFDGQVLELEDVSPDGAWAVLTTPLPDDPSASETVAVPIHGGQVKSLCVGPCVVKWSPDGRRVYVGSRDEAGRPRLVERPAAPGDTLPVLAAPPPPHAAEGSRAAGRHEQLIELDSVAPGLSPSMYVYTMAERRANLFRVTLR